MSASDNLSNELFHNVHRGLDLAWHGNNNIGFGNIDKKNLGTHWSASQDVAEKFANKNSKYPSWRTNYAKILHAQVPMSSVETDTETMKSRGYGNFGGKDPLGEKEVMVKEGAPVKLTGITKLRESKDKNEVKSRKRSYNPPREMKA